MTCSFAGYGGQTVNFLRLYSARASHDFDMQIFNDGDYFKAVEQKIASETISKVLYPSDAIVAGQELRLVQEYFLVACAVRDIVRRFEQNHDELSGLPRQGRDSTERHAPRSDGRGVDAASSSMRKISPGRKPGTSRRRASAYTNHTLAPEALEKWPVPLLESVLPRHLQIIYEINRRFLEQVAVAYPGDTERLRRMSLIEESTPKQVRMANLAIVGSHSINGVSAIHTEIDQDVAGAGFLPALAGKIQQQDQRHHAAALAAEGQPGAGGPDLARPSATAGSRISPNFGRSKTGRRMQASRPSFAGSSGRIRNSWPESFETARTSKWTPILSSIFRSSGFMPTSGSCST